MLAARLKHFFNKYHVAYLVLNHDRTPDLDLALRKLEINPAFALQAIPIHDGQSPILAILLHTNDLNLEKLSYERPGHYRLLTAEETEDLFVDCEFGACPPLGEPYGLKMVIDKQIFKLSEVYFDSGCHTSKIYMTLEDYLFLLGEVSPLDIATLKLNRNRVDVINDTINLSDASLAKDFITQGFNDLPAIANDILALQSKPLVEGIQILSGMMQKVAGELTQFSSCTFHHLDDTSKGIQEFWWHAQMAAELSKILAIKIDHFELKPANCYWIGWVHNFGLLLLAHLYPHEFRLLNKWRMLQPKAAIDTLERRLIGMGHAQKVLSVGHAHLGGLLMRQWGMPEWVISIVEVHHNPHYEGPHHLHVQLLQLTNHLLKGVGMGDGEVSSTKVHRLCHDLGCSVENAHEALNSVLNATQFKEIDHHLIQERIAISLAT